jgi:hypothetical protein
MASDDPRGSGHIEDAFSQMAPRLVAPKLGPVLLKSVGRARFHRVISALEARQGEEDTARSLRALYNAILPHEHEDSRPWSEDVMRNWKAEAARFGEPPDFFAGRLMEALEAGRIDTWASEHRYPPSPLSIDDTSMLGGDPQIDITVRKLIGLVRQRLQTYPVAQGDRLINACITFVQIFKAIRDDLPLYTLSDLDTKRGKKGLGQDASEGDLQEDLFNRLRSIYGRAVDYEASHVAGGRADLRLKFPEVEFPIEVKAEYNTIKREHIRKSYLTQPDTYATERDRVSFLLILDACKSRSHQKLAKGSRLAGTSVDDPVKLYSLDESFWADGLPADPQIEGAKLNAVIIGLVPGNRRIPSATTMYSQRPSKT